MERVGATETENNENSFAPIGFRVCDSIVYIMSLRHCSSYIIGRALNSIFSRRFAFCSIRKRSNERDGANRNNDGRKAEKKFVSAVALSECVIHRSWSGLLGGR